MKKLMTLLLSLSAALAQKPVPLEIIGTDYLQYTILGVSHLNSFDLTNKQLLVLEKLNKNISQLTKDDKREVIENSLKEKLLSNSVFSRGHFNISSSFIKKVEKKIIEKSDIYTRFSKLFIESVIADYKEFFKAGFIDRYQSFSRNNPQELKLYRELNTVINTTSHVLHQFLTLSAEEFNKKLTDIILDAMLLARQKAYYLKSFTKLNQDTIDFVKITKKAKKVVAPPSKEPNLIDAVKGIEEGVMEGASKEIDKLPVQ